MKYRDIRRDETYFGRLVYRIFPADSDGAGPGLLQVDAIDNVVAYQEFETATRSRCSAREFARWASRQETTA